MVAKRSLVALTSMLVAIVPVLSGATSRSMGRITANGHADVNGVAVASEATVFSGDRVTTARESVANLVLSAGSRVILPAGSSVTVRRNLKQDVVVLESGALAVLTRSSSPAVIEVRGANVVPEPGQASVIEVALEGNDLKVMSRRGSATVVASNKTFDVPAGKELDATVSPASDPQGPQGNGTAPASATISYAKWLVIGSFATGLTGLGLGAAAYANTTNPASCQAVSSTGSITCP